MEDIIEQITDRFGYEYIYGRKDYQNLYNEIENDVLKVFLDPVVVEDSDGDNGEVEHYIHTGNVMLLYSSDMNKEDYKEKYENYIKPLVTEKAAEIKGILNCEYEVTIKKWRKTHIVNLFDYNLDGIVISFIINIDAE